MQITQSADYISGVYSGRLNRQVDDHALRVWFSFTGNKTRWLSCVAVYQAAGSSISYVNCKRRAGSTARLIRYPYTKN